MGSVDLSGLVRGIMAIIGIALATGQYGKIEIWARKQAMHAMDPNAWKPLTKFSAVPVRHHGSGERFPDSMAAMWG